MEIRVLPEFTVIADTNFTLSVYSGFGYRYLSWNGNNRITSTGLYTCMRESNYYYSPIGTDFVVFLNEKSSLWSYFEFDYFWRGKQVSRASQLPGAYSTDLINKQRKGYGLRISLEYHKKAVRRDYLFGIFIRCWNIDRSDYGQFYRMGIFREYGVEPANRTLEYGSKFGLIF